MGIIMRNSVPYAVGSDLPEGGTKGQALVKASNMDVDVEWADVGGSIDAYTKEETDALLDEKASLNIATIPGGGGGDEISATVSQGTDSVNVNYYKDTELPDSLNLNVGADSFRIPTTDYVNGAVTDKTLAPSGWGVARTGVATVTFNNSKWSSSATVDVSDLGFSSGADYDVVAQPTTGGTATPWGNAIAFVNADKGASSFSVSSFTMEETLSGTVNVKYTIFAKGYGGTHFVDGTGLPTGGVMGQVLAKRSDTDGDVLWKNVNTDSTSVNKANLQGRMVGVYTDDIGGDTTKRFMVMNDSTNKEVVVSFRNAEAELNETAQLYHKDAVDTLLEGKQDTLVSGTSIKTVNGQSLLGSGDVGVVDQSYDPTSTNAQSGTAVAAAVGDLSSLTTTVKTSAVGAINELDAAVKGLGEPFRVKQWGSSTLNVEIPYCTEDIANGSITKMVFSIDDVEGADYQIVGMVAYEVFDAASGGNRINCWPVCQFTGNGQKELSVRWMCGGTTRKTAKRINAWVLLKHR